MHVPSPGTVRVGNLSPAIVETLIANMADMLAVVRAARALRATGQHEGNAVPVDATALANLQAALMGTSHIH